MPDVPRYRQIADDLRTRISAGELAAGQLVPSARRIAAEHGVALATATRVLADLREDGLVRAVPGVGTMVVDRPDRTPRRRSAAPAHPDPRDLRTEQVVAVAVAMADEDGLGGLSMRRIAAELGVATMSLYPRVRGKEELLVLMLDAVFAESPPPIPPPGASWRVRVELLARTQWACYRRHPWSPGLMSMSRPQNAPHGMLHTEALLRAFAGHGLDQTTMLHAAVTVAGYVRGCAINLESEARAEQDTGLTADQWMRATQPAFDAVLAAGGFPMLTAVGEDAEIDMDLNSLFEFGLARLLDGFVAWLGTGG
ncbi:TetR/AcrR family transcriptional regulator C-terminal domain-containing protein [Pseudonocardia humida]|uniref:TetR/AcrR family transcriptional regulator C-terminal domain-containing protein n=1 Tax=Pseudonocardia humida TaxID=2800819 RepID=A0ABT0ZX51_9PSEU|nr:TetR/AcrR family transcriptional regulator C-terminal domain-containing protein [Pseudonocardia humida]MCO1655250.1 TetR/AcrR family transcriptional regulator C-terminal domain-containing protein [Pseudonocardia humida]